MNKDLQNLISLAKIDKEASQLEPKITEIEDALNEKIKLKEQVCDELSALRSGLERAKLDIRSNEALIDDNREKLEQIDKKMASIKSEHELRALDAENGLAREKITFANEEINKLQKEIENFKEKEAEVQSRIDALDKEIETQREESQKSISKIKESLKKVFDTKEKIAKNIDNKVLIFYEKIRKWAKDTSVVEVRKQACSGCFIKINDMVYSELIKSDNITTCPHCGRIIYVAS